MVFKIKTSKKTMQLFEEMTASTNYAPFILSKLSISISIKSGVALEDSDFKTDTYGLELNRQTITSEWDQLYKCLIEIEENRYIEDDEYFQKYIKAHLDRGAKLLRNESRYGMHFYKNMLTLHENI